MLSSISLTSGECFQGWFVEYKLWLWLWLWCDGDDANDLIDVELGLS